MKYWSGTDIINQDVEEGENMIPRKKPAAAGAKLTVGNKVWGYYELEIVPGTLREGWYVNPSNLNKVYGTVVDVETRYKRATDTTWINEYKHALPIADFGLTDIPTPVNVFDAYDQAMKGI